MYSTDEEKKLVKEGESQTSSEPSSS